MDYWDVLFRLPDGSTYKNKIIKIHGVKRDVSDMVYYSDNSICCELSQDVGYIKIFSFNKSFIDNDKKIIQGFMNKSQGKYKKLIIDIRRNSGGDPYYWMNILVQPIIKNTITYEEKAAFKKEFIKREGLRFYAYKQEIQHR
jgi:C-terminal processing protease CtpA/Prc